MSPDDRDPPANDTELAGFGEVSLPDTIPAPAGVDAELVEAFAADVEVLADGAESTAHALRGLVASMRKQAAEARATK